MKKTTAIVLMLLMLSTALEGCKGEKKPKIDVWYFGLGGAWDSKKFKAEQTGGRGKTAVWKRVEDKTASNGEALLVEPDPESNKGECFNLFLSQDIVVKDLTISVKVKAVKGKEDQGGGVVWRAEDRDNYYVARWNPLEKNFRLYYVKDGIRKMIATKENINADPKKWHKIKVVHKGNKIECFFDGQKMISTESQVFNDEGRVGLWTKADATTEFDDLNVIRE